jgi:acyl-CoA dehydrogenase
MRRSATATTWPARRGSFTFDIAVADTRAVDVGVPDELTRRGAWARCNQIVGVLDAAYDLTVAHTGERVQFGRPLTSFRLCSIRSQPWRGEIERDRATTALAVAAAGDYGFDHPATDYAVTAAKVAVGRAVGPVTTATHQLHGAIGVTIEHRLWPATMRARSCVDPWDVVVSYPAPR